MHPRQGWNGICATVAFAGAAALALQHLASLSLPGCGPASACAQLAASPWGTFLGWPVSYWGATYFAGLSLAFWSTPPEGPPATLRWIVLLGGGISIAFLGRMAVEQTWCGYCLAVHVANLSLVVGLIANRPSMSRPMWSRPLVIFLLGMAGVAGGLGVVDHWHRDRVERDNAAELANTIEQASRHTSLDDAADGTGFTGRHPLGADKAMARLVVFHDYQCRECQELDTALDAMRVEFPSLAVSVRHYPLCAECNPALKYRFFHQEACAAAQLAEAAGRLGGEDAFWTCHRWLFERKGKYIPSDVAELAEVMGVDAVKLQRLADSAEIREIIAEDVSQANKLGATGTPFVFLNGVEVRGTSSDPKLVRQAVEAVLANSPPELSPAADSQPQEADDRMLTEFEAADLNEKVLEPVARHALGSENARHRLVLMWEYQSEYSPELWQAIENLLTRRTDVRVELVQFPVSKALNPNRFGESSPEFYPNSSKAVQLAEAAFRLGGSSAFWQAHRTLMTNWPTISVEQVAEATHLDAPDLQREMGSTAIAEAIASDIVKTERLDVKWATAAWLDGKKLPTLSPSVKLLERILDAPPKR